MEETVSEPSRGRKLCDCVFELYKPEVKVPVQLEVVLVHGLELSNCGDAYWKTWLARDGTKDNIWPMTWLPEVIPSVQVFALKYDASIKQTPKEGRMDLYLLGESLVQELVDFVGIGQNGVSVVFVCHGFGGLVAKQIIVSARRKSLQDQKAQKLLQNIGAVLFYSTPHHGSHLAKYLAYHYNISGVEKGSLLKNFEPLDVEIARLNRDFEQARGRGWLLRTAAETHETSQYGQMMVGEGSSRYEGADHLSLSVDHFDIVRPKTREDSCYLLLITCLRKVLDSVVVHLPLTMESLGLESLVRLKEQEEEIKRRLAGVAIVGLIGMGGIGKTTLAKAVYQSICKDFERSSYLDDVKSKASLDEVLIVLLQHFGIKDRKTGRLAEQSDLKDSKKELVQDLKLFVQQNKVLVVVDDIGSQENLDSLLKDMGFLDGKKDSKLIVTCRNWQVLKHHVKPEGKYEVELMRSGEDIELFSYHAFKGARTPQRRAHELQRFLSKDSSERLMDDFERLCASIVKACGGLPLSLQVMGGCLGGYLKEIGGISSLRCLELWRGALRKLKDGVPLEGGVDNDRLWKVLKISYDALHENERSMFLDIACFFCGLVRYDERTLERILGGEHPKSNELQNLKERCLVKVNKEDGTITVHDQLRDLGRSIVRDEGGQDVKKMTRLWDCNDVKNLLQSNEIKSRRIQGLSLQGFSMEKWRMQSNSSRSSNKQRRMGFLFSMEKWRTQSNSSRSSNKQRRMGFLIDCPNLRLLNLQGAESEAVDAISIEYLSSIHWLCMDEKIMEVPTWVWDCEELFVLDLRNCTSLNGLDASIGNLANLSTLHLYYCGGLTSLPDTIGNLANLSTLNLSYREGLTSLPDTIGKLANLSTLDLSHCKRITSLPDTIGKLANLSTLDLSHCRRITSLPDTICNLANLSTLGLSVCFGLRSLPYTIGKLANLSTLNLSHCLVLTSLPDTIGKLANLSTLDLSHCKRITSLPDTIGNLANLSTLNFSHCEGLTSLPDTIGNLANLSTLNFSHCEGLTSLPDTIGNLANLSTLHLSWCKGLTSLPDTIGNLANLSTLNLSWCLGLKSLPDTIGNLANLSTLDLSKCWRLKSLPNTIGNLANLSTLNLSYCEGLTSLPDTIGNLANLSTLDLSWCKRLTRLPDTIGNLANLSTLDLSWCEGLASFPDTIGKLANLSTLNLSHCKRLTRLPDTIGNLANLSTLDLSWCEGLTSFPDTIGKLANLSTLNLSHCKRLTRLPDTIGNLANLSTLDLSHCVGFTSFPDTMQNLANLSKFYFLGCGGLEVFHVPFGPGSTYKYSIFIGARVFIVF